MDLGSLLSSIDAYSSPPDGEYMVCVDTDSQEEITTAMRSMLIFFADEEESDDFFHFLEDRNLTTVGDLRIVQHIVDVARGQKPNATAQDLLASVLYFLDHDAFLEL